MGIFDDLKDRLLRQPRKNLGYLRAGAKSSINQVSDLNRRMRQFPGQVARGAKYFAAPRTSPRYNKQNDEPRLNPLTSAPTTPLFEDFLSIPRAEQAYKSLQTKVKPAVSPFTNPKLPKFLQPTENVRARDYAREAVLTPNKLVKGITDSLVLLF